MAVPNLTIRLRVLPLACTVAGMLCLSLGLLLARSSSAWLVGFVGQTGTPNQKILEKVRLVPFVLTVTGVEFLGFGCLSLAGLRRERQRPVLSKLNLATKQHWMIVLLSAYLFIGLLALNFGSVTLWQRMLSARSSNNEGRVAADFGEDYDVFRTIQELTPAEACILIKTRDPIKYLLNYHLFPRRFFFYPDPNVAIAKVPMDWLRRHAIGWTLEIKEGDPRHFALRRAEGSDGIQPRERSGNEP